MKNIFVFFLLLVSSVFLSRAQDPEFTQFYANPIYLNPAFAGTAKGPRFVMNYRNQWPTIPSTFITYSSSWDQHFDVIGGGIGFQLMYDRAGEGNLATTTGAFMYSYHLNVNRKLTIKMGIQAMMGQKSIDFSKLLFFDQIDRKLGFIYATQEKLPANGYYSTNPYLDFSSGFLAFTKKFYAGFAVNHINKPQISFLDDVNSVWPIKFTSHVGMLIPMENTRTPTTFFSPNILFQKQDKFMQFNIGAYYIKDYFIAGIWYRQTSENMDAFMALIGVKKDPVKIGYSYDITSSNARIGAKGSHEVSLIIELKTYKRPPSVKWRKLDCPTF